VAKSPFAGSPPICLLPNFIPGVGDKMPYGEDARADLPCSAEPSVAPGADRMRVS
ncbi:unnamed protein product, partial [Linum tenue]